MPAGKGREWAMDAFLSPEPPMSAGGTWGGSGGGSNTRGSIGHTSVGDGRSRRARTSAAGSGTGGGASGAGGSGGSGSAGSTWNCVGRRTQFESEKRATLRSQMTQWTAPSVLDHPVRVVKGGGGGGDAGQSRMRYTSPLGAAGTKGRPLEEVWKNSLAQSAGQSVVTAAEAQLAPPAEAEAEGAARGYMMTKPAFRNSQVVPGEVVPLDAALRPGPCDITKETLRSARQRRADHERTVAAQRALTELAAARRRHNRFFFISKTRHPHGVLMSEGLATDYADGAVPQGGGGGGVYAEPQRRIRDEEATAQRSLQRRTRCIEESWNRSGPSGALLTHSDADSCPAAGGAAAAAPFLQRRNHESRMRDTFRLAEMQDETPRQQPARRRELLAFSQSSDTTRDIITGVPKPCVAANPYA